MKLRSIGLILPLTTLLMSSAVSSSWLATGPQSNAQQKKSVVARGHLIGTQTFQQVVVWTTGSGREPTAHLAVESTGTRPRSLWQAEEGFPATDINSVRVVDLDGDGVPEIIGLWASGDWNGARLRVFHWDRRAQTFVELEPKDEQDQKGITGAQSYRLQPRGIRQRIVVFGRGELHSPMGEFEVRGSEIVRAEGGTPVTPQGRSGIEGQAVISPAHPGPIRQGETGTTPYKTTLAVSRLSDGHEVARVETGSDGRFRVSLPPGEYTIGPPPEEQRRRFPRGEEQTVKVLPGQFTKVTVGFDSGIR
ncbi:MAG TPA: hypothetical protein VNS63_02340 [Blastocatellia bacterium]|nr:hypothetical protein [Blastocatellia bacterium]